MNHLCLILTHSSCPASFATHVVQTTFISIHFISLPGFKASSSFHLIQRISLIEIGHFSAKLSNDLFKHCQVSPKRQLPPHRAGIE
ncbi:hypothetical protein T01_12797 [Trichinella spiralis]|uniref:Uncharacterized protein n=1 Tax=Trichinella spiralis TaxID=6334 RepID=A0A0V1AXZ4_TRISP|nr:hypothetical protein T01_12797 [Trichinella spiralis]